MEDVAKMGESLGRLAAAQCALTMTPLDIYEIIMARAGWTDDEAFALCAADREAFFEQLADRLVG